MLGYEPAEFVTDPTLWFKSLHPEDVPAMEEATREIFSGKTMSSRAYRVRHKTSGEYRWIEDRAVPKVDDSGTVVGWFGVARDITDRKRAEQTVHELWGRLLRLQDEERRRIARELHDTTAQNLAALNMNLVLLEKAVPPDDARSGRLLADCQQLADHIALEIRTLSYRLHPPLLDEFGLVRAMRDYAEGFSQRSGIRVELDAPEDLGRLLEDTEMALFRVLQESLGNVHRHSGSPVARIRLARNDTQLRLEIRDEGHGLPADLVNVEGSLGAAAGVGFLGMRERMQQLGGSLELETGLPGALVRAVLPIKEPMQ
jgi:PAS domain S-box-containing protein